MGPAAFVRAFAVALVTTGLAMACADTKSVALVNDDAGDGSIVGCNTVPQLGEPVEIRVLSPGSPIPDTPGGSIPDGTYVLVRMELVPKAGVAGTTGVILQQTIRISGASIAIVQSDQSGESRSLGTFTVGTTGLARSDSCVIPKPDGGESVDTAAFVATTEGLVLVTRTGAGAALIATYLPKSGS
jgi:hypothetical protein